MLLQRPWRQEARYPQHPWRYYQPWPSRRLLLLFEVDRMLAQFGAILLERQLFTATFAKDCVVVIARFLTYEEHGFFLLLRLGHL